MSVRNSSHSASAVVTRRQNGSAVPQGALARASAESDAAERRFWLELAHVSSLTALMSRRGFLSVR